jgi:hypothetical protein
MYRIDSVSLKHSVFSLYEELSNCRTQTPTFAILVELLILDLMTFTTGCDHFRPLKSSILTIRPAKVCKVSAPTAMSDGSHSCAKPMDGPRTYPSDMAPNPTQDCWCSSTNDSSPLAKDHTTTQMARTDHRRNLPARKCAHQRRQSQKFNVFFRYQKVENRPHDGSKVVRTHVLHHGNLRRRSLSRSQDVAPE